MFWGVIFSLSRLFLKNNLEKFLGSGDIRQTESEVVNNSIGLPGHMAPIPQTTGTHQKLDNVANKNAQVWGRRKGHPKWVRSL